VFYRLAVAESSADQGSVDGGHGKLRHISQHFAFDDGAHDDGRGVFLDELGAHGLSQHVLEQHAVDVEILQERNQYGSMVRGYVRSTTLRPRLHLEEGRPPQQEQRRPTRLA